MDQNNLDEIYAQFREECRDIAQQCSEEGYPDHGSNYDLRVEDLRNWYREQYPDAF